MTTSTTLCAALALALMASPAVQAANFAVTGTVTFNGNSGALPGGGTFGNSTYDTATGALSNGKFIFPQATTTVPVSGFGNVDVTYQLSQTNTSTAQIASDGVAAMSLVQAKLEIVLTSLPVSITPCVFQLIPLDFAGTGSATGLDLADAAFTIPPAPVGNCGLARDQINNAIAGSNNSMQIHIAGNFTPPPEDDTIFKNGFDPAAGFAE
jgi:hypothetical protein